MQKKYISLLLLVLTAALPGSSAPRSYEQMKAIARQALLNAGPSSAGTDGSAAARGTDVKLLRRLQHCMLIGHEGGSFAIVPTDDAQPGLIGVCTSGVSGHDNPNFEWWLQAADRALQAGVALSPTLPDPDRFPQHVGPLMTTTWGQGHPFNDACPVDSFGDHCFTGCVATSMAQVMAYHRMPVRGQGEGSVRFPYKDPAGQLVYVHFGAEWFDWDHMRDSYRAPADDYTADEARAVSQLMVACGVAADMEYGTTHVRGGSAALSSVACEGLVRHFGFSEARNLRRDDYSEPEWMEMVYQQLSQFGPIIYGGSDGSFGHSFVLHGYREDGFVCVNWGWEGDADGFYDISLLNPTVQRFSEKQGMIIGIKGSRPPKGVRQQADVAVVTPGTLVDLLPQDALTSLNRLSVSGQLDEKDMATLKQLSTEGLIETLDLSEARFPGGHLPAQQFYGSPWLTDLRLPQGITSFGNAALGSCPGLRSVSLPEAPDRQFVVDGNLVFNADTTQLICLFSTATGCVKLPSTVTAIHPRALSGCVGLDTLWLPASLKSIGGEALLGCGGLAILRCAAKTPPTLAGYNTFQGVFLDACTLGVPSGTRTQYMRKAQWKDFAEIAEFGTTIKAKNAIREYGQPNPQFSYEVSGVAVSGTPELYTDATETSPPGVYTIYVLPGTITAPDVEYIEGKLIVRESSGVQGVAEKAESGGRRIYSLWGTGVSSMRRGLNIVRDGGASRKVIVR